MATIANLLVRLGVDTRTVKSDLDKGTKDIDESGKRSGKRFSKSFTAGLLTGGGLAGAFALLKGQAGDAIAAFAEAEQAQQQLADAFARFPNIADTNIDRLREINKTLMSKTKFDDDALASGQAVLAQFKLSGRQIEDVTPLLADYAAKTGKTLPEAAETLGKSFLGNVRALKELGINYKSTGDQAKDTENIIGLLRQQVGGFAEKQGRTAAGRAAILSNQFGEIKETIGSKLLPALMKLGSWGLKTIDWMQRNERIVRVLAVALGVIAATTIAVTVATKAWAAIQVIIKAATAAATAVQWAWNIALMANPIGLIILAIAALIAIIVLIATKTTWFQTIWAVAWGAVKAAAGWVWDHLKAFGLWIAAVFVQGWRNNLAIIAGAWQWIKDKAIAVWDWIKSLPGMIASAFSSLAGFILAPFKTAFSAIARFWNNTVGKLKFTIPSWVPILGGKTWQMPQLPTFHKGGIVPGSGEQLIVAQGGEGLFTEDQMAALGRGAGQRMVLELRSGGSALDNLLIELLLRALRRDPQLRKQLAVIVAGA